MARKLGYKSYVGFGEESSLGTFAAPEVYIEYNSESMQKEINEQVIEAVNGTRTPTKRVTLEETAGGGFSYPVVIGTELKLFRHLSGCNYSMSTVTAGVYQFTFKIDTVSSQTSLSMQICRDTSDTDSTYNYTGCKCNTANIGISVGNLLACDIDLMCVDMASADTISTASYNSNNPYTFKDATINIGDNSGAATATSLTDWSVSLGQQLIEVNELGSATRVAIEEGMLDVTGEMSMSYQDQSQLNRFLNKTKTYIEAEFDSGVTITGAYNHSITFKSYNSYYNGSVPNIGSANEIISQSIPWRSIRENSSNGVMEIVVQTSANTIT